ncbi:hypothetical protein BGZ63DRAFT_405965 [Mariannaea sp. PMI_226]|nr:hypothetical protein BGZ63DRAFT_405965 [Mariannaea sp. PMI_226]
MASQLPQDPLDVLQLMVNDVLVQTGKALRASRKDGQGNVAQAHGSLQNKLPDTISTFHNALDELENDIIRAKSVLLRDLTQIRQQKMQEELQQQQQQQQQEEQYKQQQQLLLQQEQEQQPVQTLPQPEPIEPQSKEAMVIDLDSSPPPTDQPMTETKATKPVAPFPDMGMGLPDLGHNDIIKSEAPSIPSTTTAAATAPMAPMPDMDEKPVDIDMDISGGDLSNQELNFTNMEFSLAPTTNDGQNPSSTQDPSFDLTTFAPAEGRDDLLGFEDLLPPNPNEQADAIPTTQSPVKVESSNQMNSAPDMTASENMLTKDFGTLKKEETGDSTFEDILMEPGNDFGNLGDLGEDSFNDLLVDRDDTFDDLMDHGDFDEAAYFGLDGME